MQLNNWIARNSALTWTQLFDPWTGAVRLRDDGQGNISIVAWNAALVGIPQPTTVTTPSLAQIAAMPEADSVEGLIAYLSGKQTAVLAAGITINVAASGQPAINILVDGTTDTKADVNGLYNWGVENPTATETWYANNGTQTVLTGAQFVTLGNALKSWVSNVVAFYATQAAAVMANRITLTSQIDPLVWPSS